MEKSFVNKAPGIPKKNILMHLLFNEGLSWDNHIGIYFRE
jgi:hypothetical protein